MINEFFILEGKADKPECILRVEKLANKKVIFEEIDITNKTDLEGIFDKVRFKKKIIFIKPGKFKILFFIFTLYSDKISNKS